MKRQIAIAALSFASTALVPSIAEANDAYVLVIGADAYVGLKALGGAVNDARLLSQTFRSGGARDVVTLTDADATRANITSAFQILAAKAQAGDWLIVTYAGHGGQEREALTGDETDGLDEVMLLPGYMDRAPENGERLRDNDIYALFAGVRPDVTIFFVADACHSGTMTRTVDPRAHAVETRFADYGPINDTLAPPPASTSGHDTGELPNVVFAAASLDTEATPEIALAGQSHGALSFYVAKAIAGAADLDRNGAITLGEFRRYVMAATRLASESRQTPDVRFDQARANEIMPFGNVGSAPSPPSEPVLTVSAGDATLPPGVPSAPSSGGDFLWDASTGAVVSSAGDLVATVNDGSGLTGVIEKWRFLPQLQALAAQSPAAVDIAPRGAGARYRDGEMVDIVIAPLADFGEGYFTVVNLAADGTVQGLFPSASHPEEAGLLALGERRRFAVRAGVPFGADHVVAVVTKELPQEMREQLASLQGQRASRAAVASISEAVDTRRYALGLVGLYTGAD